MTTWIRRLAVLLTLAWAMAWVGCGDDEGGTPPDAEGAPDATEVVCAPEDPLVPAESLPVCELCPDARCVPNAALSTEQQELLAPCPDEGSTCVPELFINTNGNFTLETCTSVAGAEGRCLSVCVPQVAERAEMLPQDVCDDGWLCTPCFDPITGEDTGACNQGCDGGPIEAAVTFPDCCEGAAKCIPGVLVPEEQRDQLGTEGCDEEAGDLCVPNVFAEDPSWSPPECDPGDSGSGLLSFSSGGRCMPECIPEVANPESPIGEISFSESTCDPGFLCVPCSIDFFGLFPVRNTGVCDL
jgi:hypothetical protein